jgi:peptidyl-prolyl cis-trans isomerase SurA
MLKKKFFLFALVGLFSISLHAEKLDGIAAIVNDSIITEQELQSNIKEVRQQISQGGINAPGDAELRRQVLQHLIDVSLQTEIAKSNNIMVEPEHLKQALKNIAQKNNISLSNLKKTIESQGMSWTKYKDNIKKELLMVKIQQNAVGQITVPESQVDDYIKSNQHKQHIQYHLKDIVLSLPEAPTPEQIKKAKQQANALKKQL